MKCAWIERNRRHWPISLACEVLGVSPSGYHERKAREIGDTSRSRRNISDDALFVHIRAVHAETAEVALLHGRRFGTRREAMYEVIDG